MIYPMRPAIHRQMMRRRQRGAVAVIFAIVMTAMIGIAWLALHLGQLYVAKTELQNAADACALSAAQSLSGSDGKQFQISEAAGLTTEQRHRGLFQSRATCRSVTVFSKTGTIVSTYISLLNFPVEIPPLRPY